MLPDHKVMCPATGFTKSCRSIVAEFTCPKFVNVSGHTDDGTPVSQWGCVDSFLPWLLAQNAQMSRQAGAAVESFRNEVVAREDARRDTLQALINGVRRNN